MANPFPFIMPFLHACMHCTELNQTELSRTISYALHLLWHCIVNAAVVNFGSSLCFAFYSTLSRRWHLSLRAAFILHSKLFHTHSVLYCIVLCWTEVWSWNMRLCKAPLMWYCGRYIERTHQLLSFRWFLYSFAVINGKLWTIQSSYNQRLPHSGGMTMLQLRLTFAFYQSGKSTRYSRPTG